MKTRGNRGVGMRAFHAKVKGRVQGVFFRAFVRERARSLGIRGFVRNLPDGRTVEVWAEGEGEALQKLIESLHEGPPGAIVEKVEVSWEEPKGFEDFHIRY